MKLSDKFYLIMRGSYISRHNDTLEPSCLAQAVEWMQPSFSSVRECLLSLKIHKGTLHSWKEKGGTNLLLYEIWVVGKWKPFLLSLQKGGLLAFFIAGITLAWNCIALTLTSQKIFSHQVSQPTKWKLNLLCVVVTVVADEMMLQGFLSWSCLSWPN